MKPFKSMHRIPGSRLAVFAGLLLFLCLLASSASGVAESAFVCANHAPLSLEKITGQIASHVDQERIAKSIQACQVTFQVDALSLDRLTAARASDAVMDAINQVTAARLTPEQAHTQVADLSAKAELAEKSGAPKKAIPYRARIAYLEQSTYPDPRELKYIRYDADQQQLIASIGGEEYRFNKLPAASAQTFKTGWAKVKATQPYTDDEFHTRTLEGAGISAPGISQAAIAAALHKKTDAINAEAQSRLNSHDFDGAAEQYQAVLKLDPANQTARAGLEAARAGQQAQAVVRQAQKDAGVWVDPQSRLMWTRFDNGAEIAENEVANYCTVLRWGGFSNWSLATLEELKALYDPSTDRQTTPTPRSYTWRQSSASPETTFPPGTTFPIHLKGDITLSSFLVWAASGNAGTAFSYTDAAVLASPRPDPKAEARLKRVLCVRPSIEGEALVNTPHATSASMPPPVTPKKHMGATEEVFQQNLDACNNGSSFACTQVGRQYQRGFGVDKDIVAAGVYYKKACDMGSSLGCNMLKGLK